MKRIVFALSLLTLLAIPTFAGDIPSVPGPPPDDVTANCSVAICSDSAKESSDPVESAAPTEAQVIQALLSLFVI
jgi:hypothetical protein